MTGKKLYLFLLLFLLIPLSYALSLDTEPEECQSIDFYKLSTWISYGLAKISKHLKTYTKFFSLYYNNLLGGIE